QKSDQRIVSTLERDLYSYEAHLDIHECTSLDAGDYKIVVSNREGQVTSTAPLVVTELVVSNEENERDVCGVTISRHDSDHKRPAEVTPLNFSDEESVDNNKTLRKSDTALSANTPRFPFSPRRYYERREGRSSLTIDSSRGSENGSPTRRSISRSSDFERSLSSLSSVSSISGTNETQRERLSSILSDVESNESNESVSGDRNGFRSKLSDQVPDLFKAETPATGEIPVELPVAPECARSSTYDSGVSEMGTNLSTRTSALNGRSSSKRRPPTFLKTLPLKDLIIQQGNSLYLTCQVDAQPKAKVVWMKDATNITASSEYNFDEEQTADKSAQTYKLTLHDIQPRHSGTYTVSAFNLYGDLSCHSHVNVQKTDLDPSSQIPDEYLNWEIGTLDYEINNSSKTLLRVARNREFFYDSNNNNAHQTTTQGFMHDAVVGQFSDAESATEVPCDIQTNKVLDNDFPTLNDSGSTESTLTEEEVSTDRREDNFSLSSDDNEPYFTYELQNTTVQEGDEIFLDCKINPNRSVPIIEWFKNSKPIRNQDGCAIECEENGWQRLKIRHSRWSDDEGVYSCQVETVHGVACSTAEVYVEMSKEKIFEILNYHEPEIAEESKSLVLVPTQDVESKESASDDTDGCEDTTATKPEDAANVIDVTDNPDNTDASRPPSTDICSRPASSESEGRTSNTPEYQNAFLCTQEFVAQHEEENQDADFDSEFDTYQRQDLSPIWEEDEDHMSRTSSSLAESVRSTPALVTRGSFDSLMSFEAHEKLISCVDTQCKTISESNDEFTEYESELEKVIITPTLSRASSSSRPLSMTPDNITQNEPEVDEDFTEHENYSHSEDQTEEITHVLNEAELEEISNPEEFSVVETPVVCPQPGQESETSSQYTDDDSDSSDTLEETFCDLPSSTYEQAVLLARPRSCVSQQSCTEYHAAHSRPQSVERSLPLGSLTPSAMAHMIETDTDSAEEAARTKSAMEDDIRGYDYDLQRDDSTFDLKELMKQTNRCAAFLPPQADQAHPKASGNIEVQSDIEPEIVNTPNLTETCNQGEHCNLVRSKENSSSRINDSAFDTVSSFEDDFMSCISEGSATPTGRLSPFDPNDCLSDAGYTTPPEGDEGVALKYFETEGPSSCDTTTSELQPISDVTSQSTSTATGYHTPPKFYYIIPPKFLGKKSVQVSVLRGGTALLGCSLVSHPEAKVAWYKDGRLMDIYDRVSQEISNEPPMDLMESNGMHGTSDVDFSHVDAGNSPRLDVHYILKINNVVLKDEGLYICKAWNVAGVATRIIRLAVLLQKDWS
ncbi:uncharacterized protein LOC113474550, partial [Ciona intestinalis]